MDYETPEGDDGISLSVWGLRRGGDYVSSSLRLGMGVDLRIELRLLPSLGGFQAVTSPSGWAVSPSGRG